MEKLSEKIKRAQITPYQRIAKKYDTTSEYVGLIARGRRRAQRGKALKIKKELEKLIE